MKKIIFLFLLANLSAVAQQETKPSGANDNNKTITAVATKRVLIEEATGTWCGFCVRGIVMMEALNKDYPLTTALIAVHNDDPMTDAIYDAAIGPKIPGYPSGLIDRQAGEIDPSDFKTEYLKRVTYAPAIDVFIDKVSWNAMTRSLSFRVNATTVATFNGSYRFNAVITEMQVHGTAAAYDQHNYYSDGSMGAMGGFETKSDPVPAADMYYDFVGRTLLDGWDGTANSIPATNASGQTISYTYTKIIPTTWKEKNLNLIGFVINSTDGTVENASLTVKLQSVITGIDNGVEKDLAIYPNPTTGLISIKNAGSMDISVYNVTGSLILKTEGNVSQIDLSDLPAGIYFLKLNNQKETYTKKVVLTK